MEIGNGVQLGLHLHPNADFKIDNPTRNNEEYIGIITPPRTPIIDSPHLHSREIFLSNLESNSDIVNGSHGSNISHKASDLLMAVSICAEDNIAKIKELATKAMEEVTKLALEKQPLSQLQEYGNTEVLNDVECMGEYGKFATTLVDLVKMVEVGESQCVLSFGNGNNHHHKLVDNITPLSILDRHPVFGSEEYLHHEASRETCLVRMNPMNLVELLMDLKQWSSSFSSIVSRAKVLGILSPTGGVEGKKYDGVVQVMTAEFHIPTPLVHTRESYFARHCKQLPCGTWAVVDVSLEDIFPHPSIKYRRKPSGCLIQELQNQCSRVIWVEHVEVDNRMVHDMFKPLVNSGFAFGANRWVGAIIRQCEWLSTLMATATPTIDGILIPEAGRTSLLKLSERMTKSFFSDINACSSNTWIPLPIHGVGDHVRFMTKHNLHDPGKPLGGTIAFATSIHIPSPPNNVFDFLRHETSRAKWDVLSHGHTIQELVYVINGDDPRNRISTIQVNAGKNQIAIFYLQASYSDSTGSYVIYAPIDILAISMLLNGGNPDEVTILPSGFYILTADNPAIQEQEAKTESLLTIAFHIVDSASTKSYVPFESLETMYKIITETATSIQEAIISP